MAQPLVLVLGSRPKVSLRHIVVEQLAEGGLACSLLALLLGRVFPTGDLSGDVLGNLSGFLRRDVGKPGDVDAFRLPEGSSYLGMEVLVQQTSDAGSSATLKLANSAGDIITGFDVATATGLLSLAAGDASIASSSRFVDPAASADTNQQLVYEESGTAGTQGEFLARIYYIQGE